jgi:hypothetical protein
MRNFPIINSNFLDTLMNQLFKRKQPKKLTGVSGSQYPLGHLTNYARRQHLEIPFTPVRPIKNSFQTSIELLEISEWSYELRHSVSIISRDVFQSLDGRITSWSVSPTYKDKKINKEVLVIANSLATRSSGKELILGGNFLQRAVRDFLFFGDAFVSLGFDRDGISKEWHISESLYLPTLSTFVDVDEQNKILSYSQRESTNIRDSDIFIHPLKVLQFSYEKNQVYGNPISYQSLEPWRQLQEISRDLEQAARDTGYSMLLHKFPEQVNEMDKESYQSRYEDMLNTGIVTNLYLLPGMEVERIAADSGALEPLMRLWLQKRYECIPPGLPLYLFPGLGIESTSGKEISAQPATNYARFIASIRGILSEQIRWAISLEMVLTRGIEFYNENKNFDIEWGSWVITGNEDSVLHQDTPKEEKNQNYL